MSKKWAYVLALLFLLIIRVGVIDTNYDGWLESMHYTHAAHFISSLRTSPPFVDFMGSWVLPIFIFAVLVFWMTEEDTADISKQFLLLPIAYIPFSVIWATLINAEFNPAYLYVHPLIILPFGYLYVSFWTILIWGFEKMKLVE